jgi:ectoine hydroxylase-related dioxygenase (phytanoyl-CoA dioxygenase family)
VVIMLTRQRGYLNVRSEGAPEASQQLERDGYAVIRGVLTAAEVAALAAEIEALYAALPPDGRAPKRPVEEDNDFRYEMLNRSALCQSVIGHRAILEVIEPLLGEDCHVIANTCWRNPPRERNTHGGGAWHIDAGPHVPRPPGIPWDERIPYPVFAIGAHIYLKDCPLECGPTGVIPRSHKSGQRPPDDRVWDVELTCDGRGVVPLTARSGDVAMFVSDVWHRRLPPLRGDSGRFFLQAHYGRRDIAQRIRTTSRVNQLSALARKRAKTPRQRTLVGLHQNFFYDG